MFYLFWNDGDKGPRLERHFLGLRLQSPWDLDLSVRFMKKGMPFEIL